MTHTAKPADSGNSRIVLDSSDISRAITRLAHEIVERTHGAQNLTLMGIPTRGAALANRLAEKISQIQGTPIAVGAIDVTMFRDDLRLRPARALQPTKIPAEGIDNRLVVLVDDVLYSGRTIRAALDALSEHGRPQAVQLAVLVDRGHRELPIRADYVGKNLPTASAEVVRVQLVEHDEVDQVAIAGGR